MMNYLSSYSKHCTSFYLLLATSVCGLSSSSLVGTWIWLEINMMLFMFVAYYESSHSIMVKYFFSQAIFSAMLLSVTLIYYTEMFPASVFSYLIYLSLLGKLGMPPLCFWFIEILQDTYNDCLFFLLLTTQKVLPLYMMSLISCNFPLILILFSLLFVGITAISYLNMSWVVSVSAIFNTMWMLMIVDNFNLLVWYLMIYTIHSGLLLYYLGGSSKMLTSYFVFNSPSLSKCLFAFIVFLSMSGFPPFLGFCGKFPIVMFILQDSFTTVTVLTLVLIFSVFVMYMYMNFSFKMILNPKTVPLYSSPSKGVTSVGALFLMMAPFMLLLL